MIFEGSVIEKNEYFPDDKFTVKYSANGLDLIVSVWKSLTAIGSSWFSPLVNKWLLLGALFKINITSSCYIENSDGLKDTFPSFSSSIKRITAIEVESYLLYLVYKFDHNYTGFQMDFLKNIKKVKAKNVEDTKDRQFSKYIFIITTNNNWQTIIKVIEIFLIVKR